MKKKIVLIAGLKGSGKTYTADKIVSIASKKVEVQKFSFATPLKKSCNALIEETFGEEYLKPEYKEFVRPIYQTIGNRARIISDRFWVDKVVEKIKQSNCDVAIIDDVRFPNEFDIAKGLTGVEVLKIRVVRKSSIKGEDNDASETAMNDIPDSEFDLIVGDSIYKEEIFKKLYSFVSYE